MAAVSSYQAIHSAQARCSPAQLMKTPTSAIGRPCTCPRADFGPINPKPVQRHPNGGTSRLTQRNHSDPQRSSGPEISGARKFLYLNPETQESLLD
jgi:hypothetical protein